MTDPREPTTAEPTTAEPTTAEPTTADPDLAPPSPSVAPVAPSTWPLPPTLAARAAASAPAQAPAPASAPPFGDQRSEASPTTSDDGGPFSVDDEAPLHQLADPPASPHAHAPSPEVSLPPDGPEGPPTSPLSLTKPPVDPPVPSVAASPAVLPVVTQEPAQEQVEPATSSAARGVLVPVLAALLVVLLGLTGYLGWKAADTAGAPTVETSRTQALAAARDAARAVFSYDYTQLEKDFAAGKAVTTGTFAEQYAGTTAKLLDFAVKNKATVAADVSDASVVRATETEVVCLVFLNQTSSSSAVAKPRITQSRLEMTMKRRGDTWLVAAINAL